MNLDVNLDVSRPAIPFCVCNRDSATASIGSGAAHGQKGMRIWPDERKELGLRLQEPPRRTFACPGQRTPRLPALERPAAAERRSHPRSLTGRPKPSGAINPRPRAAAALALDCSARDDGRHNLGISDPAGTAIRGSTRPNHLRNTPRRRPERRSQHKAVKTRKVITTYKHLATCKHNLARL